MFKKYLIPAIALGFFLTGTVFLLLPFIPLGWLFYLIAFLLLVPYFKWCRRIFSKLVKLDRTGLLERASKKVIAVYTWAGDYKNAELVKKIIDEKVRELAISKSEEKKNSGEQ